MLKKLLLFGIYVVLFSPFSGIKAQNAFELADIPFYKANDTLKFPMAGGFNSPIFAEIDLDLDGKNDLLVLESFGNILYPFINKGDSGEMSYEYAPAYIELLPKDMEGWIYSGDFNCDGKMDLFFLQNYNVSVYENLSNSTAGFTLGNKSIITYETLGAQAKMYYNPIYKPAIEDIDGDGDLDFLFIGDYGQVKYYKNLSLERTGNCGLDFVIRAKCWGLFTEDFNTSEILLDSCQLGRDAINERTKGNKHAGGTLSAFDVDGNQTMDLLVGDISQDHLTILINNDNSPNRVSSHIVSADDDFPSYDKSIELKSFPAAYFIDINNDQLKDLVVSTFNSDPFEPVWTENMVHLYKNTGNPVHDTFEFHQSDFLLEEMVDLGKGAHPIFYDINKDGLLDIVAGNSGSYDSLTNNFIGSLSYFENVGTALKPEFSLVDHDFANLSTIKLQGGYYAKALYPAIADLDNDGKAEMLLGDDYGKLHLFRDSSANSNPPDFKLVEKYFDKVGLESVNDCSPSFYDLNKDGLLDLLVGHDNGTIDFYPNWGNANKPVFNLQVDSIIHRNGDTVRYYFEKHYDISRLQIGDEIYFVGDTHYTNNGLREVVAVDSLNRTADVFKQAMDIKRVNEYSTEKVAFYGIKNLGNVDIGGPGASNGMATPFFYEMLDSTIMLSGSKMGTLYQYNSIDGNPDSNFVLADSNLMDFHRDYGINLYVSGADINSDDMTDLIIGNVAGGFKIYYGLISNTVIPENPKSNQFGFRIYPNPGNGYFTIDLENTGSREVEMTIYNLLGKKIRSQEIRDSKTELILTDLSTGVYFVEIRKGLDRIVKKLVLHNN